jgi:hypothetical protein
MILNGKTIGMAAGCLLIASTTAFGAVFAEKSPEQKLRADVAKQVTGYTKCLITALLACEKTGASSAVECELASSTAAATADPKAKFAAAVAKCDAKLDYDRKGPKGNTSAENYELIGCPTGSGGPPLADMDEFEEIARAAKEEIDVVAGLLPTVSGCADTKSCGDAGKVIARFANAFGKCQTACENDYKDKKGNGGTDDDTLRCGFTGDSAAAACIAGARDKFDDKTGDWPFGSAVRETVEGTIDLQTDSLFNVAPACP